MVQCVNLIGFRGCSRPCFSYPCQNLLVPLSKVKDDWQLFDCTGQAHSPPCPSIDRTISWELYFTVPIIASQSFYPTPWFEAFPALARFERKRAYQLWHAKQAVRNKTHPSYWAKTAWDVRWIMYFHLCCGVSWYSNFRCFALVCWKIIFNVQRLKVPWLELESQTVSAFPAALHDPTSTSNACQSHFLLSGSWFFGKHTDAKLFCNHSATFYIFFIIHYSWHSCANKQLPQSEADDFLFNSDK